MEEAKMETRRVIETKATQKWIDDIHLLESSGVVSESVPPLMCVSSHHQDLRNFKNQHSFYKINYQPNLPASSHYRLFCFTLTFHRAEIRRFWIKLGALGRGKVGKLSVLALLFYLNPVQEKGHHIIMIHPLETVNVGNEANCCNSSDQLSYSTVSSFFLSLWSDPTNKKVFQIFECWTSDELGFFST